MNWRNALVISEGIFIACIKPEARAARTFPVTLDELILVDHVFRVIQAFVNKLDVARPGFLCAEPAERVGRAMTLTIYTKLYLYGICSRCAPRGD